MGDTPRSIATLRRMKKMTERNRNLLLLTVMVTIGIYTTIAVVGTLTMRTVLYLCTIDRLVTLQCITMTFSYDGRELFYCRAGFLSCFESRTLEIEQEEDVCYQAIGDQDVDYQAMYARNSNSSTLVIRTSSASHLRAEN